MEQLKANHEKEVAAVATKSTAGTSKKVQELEEKANSLFNSFIFNTIIHYF